MTTTLKDIEDIDKIVNPLRQFLIFTIDNEEFGLELRDLQEIITFRDVTAIPHAGEDVEGIISLRGKIVTVIDGRKRLGREEKSSDGS
jgi:purine-binding chemotaxis protein CheW